MWRSRMTVAIGAVFCFQTASGAEQWLERDGWLGGAPTGQWTYRSFGDAPGENYTVTCDLRIEHPARARGKGHGGGRFARYDNQADLPCYEAGVVLRRDKGQMIRFMFSSAWQEVLLWSSRGGILQVKPFALAANKVYAVRATAAGRQLVLTIDGKTVVDYWDTTAPLAGGTAALARNEGVSWFRNAKVQKAPAPVDPAPKHVARFAIRRWKNQDWGFDGDEPIFVIGKDSNGYEVKLVPGYTVQLYVFWHWLNYSTEAFYCNILKDMKVEQKGSTLVFVLTAEDKGNRKDLISRTRVSVTYDAAANAYRYDHVSELVVPPGKTLRVAHPIEFTNPACHNGVQSASTYGPQWPQPHPWSVYRHVDGKLHKLPHNHATWYPGFARPAARKAKAGYLKPDGGFWAMVGDPVANPVFSLQESARRAGEFYTELCGWGYDIHMRWKPVKKEEQLLKPGTYTIRWRMSSVDGKQGDAWLKEATILAISDPKATWLLYSGGVGHVERFDKKVLQASPFGEHPWGPGTLQDTTVGRTDTTSLRLDGPGLAASTAGGSQFTERFQKDTDYEVSCWVKTKDVRGEGPGIIFGDKTYYPGITGTTDWRRIGFVTRPPKPLHTVTFALRNSGSGTAWFDDFLIRPVTADKPAAKDMAKAPRPLTNLSKAKGDLLLAWSAKGRIDDGANTILDPSGRGNHATLAGARWVEDGKTSVWEFDGETSHVLLHPSPHVDFGETATLSVWIKPGQNKHLWNVIASGGRPDYGDWMVFLFYKQSPYNLDIRVANKRFFTPKGVIQKDEWSHLAMTHDGKRMRAYVNGKLVIDEPLTKRWLRKARRGHFRLGTNVSYGNPRDAFIGRMADCRIFARALTAAEIAALVGAGRS